MNQKKNSCREQNYYNARDERLMFDFNKII